MTILDRYILKQFVLNFVILFVVLFLFRCMVDLFVNIDDLVEALSKTAEEEPVGGWERFMDTTTAVVKYYLPHVILFYTFLVGVITIGAVGFTLVQLHRNRELTAVLAAGVSLHRVAMPLIVAGLVLNMVQFMARELVLPHLAPRLLQSLKEMAEPDEIAGFRIAMARDGQGRVFYAYQYDPQTTRMSEVVIWCLNDEGRTTHRIEADSAEWNETGWNLVDGSIYEMSENLSNDSIPRQISFLESDLDPTAILLRRFGQYRQMLNLKQINQLIHRPGSYDVNELVRIRFGRFAQVLVNMLALLLTLPFFMLREPKNLLVQSVKCASVGLAAQIGGAIGTTVELSGVPSAASVFLIPLLILLPLAVLSMSRVDT